MHLHTLGWNDMKRSDALTHVNTAERTERRALAMLTGGFFKKKKNHRKRFTETSQTRNNRDKKTPFKSQWKETETEPKQSTFRPHGRRPRLEIKPFNG